MTSLVLSATYSEAPLNMAPHYHDCHQLLYIAEGAVRITVGEATYIAEKDTLILFNRFEQHAIEVISQPYKRYAVRISPLLTEQIHENYHLYSVLFNRSAGFKHAIPITKETEQFRRILQQLTDEKGSDKPFAESHCDLLLQQILIHLYRQQPSLFTPFNQEGTEIVRQIQSRFEKDFKENFSLAQLAQEYHLSTYYLSHLFKNATGYPLMHHLHACRIAAAKRYLTKTNMPIGDIVDTCGFSDNSNFSRSFKEATGLTPSEFRKKYR